MGKSISNNWRGKGRHSETGQCKESMWIMRMGISSLKKSLT